MSKENRYALRHPSAAWALLGAIYGGELAAPRRPAQVRKSHWSRPHQGNAERERRLAKIKAGKIPRSQCR